MEGLMQPDTLRARILLWAEEQIRLDLLPPKSGAILEAVLYRGELPRGDAAGVVGHGRPPSPPCRLRHDQAWRVGLREQPCAAAAGFPGRAGIALYAEFVS
jgi:hypothetical protein